MASDPGDDCDQWRLIDVPESQVLGTGEIIKFIPKDSVSAGDKEMKQDLGPGQQPDNGRPGARHPR